MFVLLFAFSAAVVLLLSSPDCFCCSWMVPAISIYPTNSVLIVGFLLILGASVSFACFACFSAASACFLLCFRFAAVLARFCLVVVLLPPSVCGCFVACLLAALLLAFLLFCLSSSLALFPSALLCFSLPLFASLCLALLYCFTI